MTEATLYLFKAILDVISLVILITFLFRLLKVDYYNPLVQGMLKFADIFTSLIRSIFRPLFGIDLASLITTIALQAFCFYLISLDDAILFSFGIMISWSLFSVLLMVLTIVWWGLVAGIVISWVARGNPHPAFSLLMQMSDQICKPFRSFLPPVAGLDFSPILAFILLNFLWAAVFGLSIEAGLPIHLSMGG